MDHALRLPGWRQGVDPTFAPPQSTFFRLDKLKKRDPTSATLAHNSIAKLKATKQRNNAYSELMQTHDAWHGTHDRLVTPRRLEAEQSTSPTREDKWGVYFA